MSSSNGSGITADPVPDNLPPHSIRQNNIRYVRVHGQYPLPVDDDDDYPFPVFHGEVVNEHYVFSDEEFDDDDHALYSISEEVPQSLPPPRHPPAQGAPANPNLPPAGNPPAGNSTGSAQVGSTQNNTGQQPQQSVDQSSTWNADPAQKAPTYASTQAPTHWTNRVRQMTHDRNLPVTVVGSLHWVCEFEAWRTLDIYDDNNLPKELGCIVPEEGRPDREWGAVPDPKGTWKWTEPDENGTVVTTRWTWPNLLDGAGQPVLGTWNLPLRDIPRWPLRFPDDLKEWEKEWLLNQPGVERMDIINRVPPGPSRSEVQTLKKATNAEFTHQLNKWRRPRGGLAKHQSTKTAIQLSDLEIYDNRANVEGGQRLGFDVQDNAIWPCFTDEHGIRYMQQQGSRYRFPVPTLQTPEGRNRQSNILRELQRLNAEAARTGTDWRTVFKREKP